MNTRKIKLIVIFVLAFFAGYFNEFLAPYFVNANFALGVMSLLLTMCFAYALWLKDALKQARRNYGEDFYELTSSVNEILREVKKKKK